MNNPVFIDVECKFSSARYGYNFLDFDNEYYDLYGKGIGVNDEIRKFLYENSFFDEVFIGDTVYVRVYYYDFSAPVETIEIKTENKIYFDEEIGYDLLYNSFRKSFITFVIFESILISSLLGSTMFLIFSAKKKATYKPFIILPENKYYKFDTKSTSEGLLDAFKVISIFLLSVFFLVHLIGTYQNEKVNTQTFEEIECVLDKNVLGSYIILKSGETRSTQSTHFEILHSFAEQVRKDNFFIDIEEHEIFYVTIPKNNTSNKQIVGLHSNTKEYINPLLGIDEYRISNINNITIPFIINFFFMFGALLCSFTKNKFFISDWKINLLTSV